MLVLWTLDYSAVLLPEKVEEMNLGFLIRVRYNNNNKKVLSTLLGMANKKFGV